MPLKQVTIYTDGACSGNPGTGGYGAVLIYGSHRKEISGGFRRTTNNRMEIMGAIAGLELLNSACTVTLYTDSQYLVNAIMKGWAKRWRTNGWKRNPKEAAKNPDLWQRLLDLCDKHDVKFVWVRGHAGNIENETCDRLAVQATKQINLPPDSGYQSS
ncbi:MAG: ribonuclease HI [Oscillatoriales cyanobacterium RM2_1_1]|nr:ribonuclease HI [Oscillatoriales cyanobacterium SM2_3_0]NJO47423.1 ribonuclease HI [Oscillatoriales cyanobacterium RM2_1_1]